MSMWARGREGWRGVLQALNSGSACGGWIGTRGRCCLGQGDSMKEGGTGRAAGARRGWGPSAERPTTVPAWLLMLRTRPGAVLGDPAARGPPLRTNGRKACGW